MPPTDTRERVEAMELHFPQYIDSTILNSFKQCELKFYREFILGLTPHATSPDLHAGGAFAAAIETVRMSFYGDKKNLTEALCNGLLKFIDEWGEYEPPEQNPKTFVRVATALIAYFDEYNPGDDHIQPYMSNNKPAVEFTFAVPLPINNPETGEPLFYCGRYDMLGIFNNAYWGVDEKTTKALGASWAKRWDLRSQFIGYAWASAQVGMPIEGIIVRGVGILKTDITFLEVPVQIPKWKIDRWLEVMLQTVRNMITAWERREWFANFDEACTAYGGCTFNTLCNSKHPAPWLNDYELRRWDPLAKDPSVPLVMEAESVQG
ncbi:MAG: hypothetical protein GTO00_09270 [Deltaproteobacteria bacterium]|nr:hypothetical protein [Deltaproteobacteria bacterium]